MIVAVFNPSLRPIYHTKIAVPHGKFIVKVFNETIKNFQDAEANVICDPIDNGKHKDCWLYVRYLVDGQ